jgi:hypothetical protein
MECVDVLIALQIDVEKCELSFDGSSQSSLCPLFFVQLSCFIVQKPGGFDSIVGSCTFRYQKRAEELNAAEAEKQAVKAKQEVLRKQLEKVKGCWRHCSHGNIDDSEAGCKTLICTDCDGHSCGLEDCESLACTKCFEKFVFCGKCKDSFCQGYDCYHYHQSKKRCHRYSPFRGYQSDSD